MKLSGVRPAWFLVFALLGAVTFVVFGQQRRVARAEHIAGLALTAPAADSSSVTGYAGGVRTWLVPEHRIESFEWITQTQTALASDDWRLRHVSYDNAPEGRRNHASPVYRGWLMVITQIHHAVTDAPMGISAERAVVWSDPLLQLVLLLGSAALAAVWFGPIPAAALTVGLATIHPLAANFLPGAPHSLGLAAGLALWSILPLVRGLVCTAAPDSPGTPPPRGGGPRAARAGFVVAGVVGGLALCNHVPSQVPLLLGLALGGLSSAWLARPPTDQTAETTVPHLWRWWAVSGAGVTLLGWLFAGDPADVFAWNLRTVHPAYAIAWLGLGELLEVNGRFAARLMAARAERRRSFLQLGIAAAAVALVPVIMVVDDQRAFWIEELSASRLSAAGGSTVAENLGAWIARDGLTLTLTATLLPLGVLVVAGIMAGVRHVSRSHRRALLMSGMAALVCSGLGVAQLGWWSLADAALLATLTAVVAAWMQCSGTPRLAAGGIGGCVALVGIGAFAALPAPFDPAKLDLSVADAESLIERDLAHWLKRRAGASDLTLVAPPGFSASLCYYGGFSGVSSLAWENVPGLTAAFRILGSTSYEEAKALLDQRQVTHVVLPSWDPTFDHYLGARPATATSSLWQDLRRWSLPNWLRPIAYQFPQIGGLDRHAVLVFEIVEEQDDADALSRLTEYFIEAGQVEAAVRFSPGLRRFPGHVGALAARIQVAQAANDVEGRRVAWEALQSRLTSRADRFLALDRRLSVAVVLARGGKLELAKAQVEKALTQLDEPSLRHLSTASLYHLHVLLRALQLTIEDPALRDLATSLLPENLRPKN